MLHGRAIVIVGVQPQILMITGPAVGRGREAAVQCSMVEANLRLYQAILPFCLLYALVAACPPAYFYPDGSWDGSTSRQLNITHLFPPMDAKYRGEDLEPNLLSLCPVGLQALSMGNSNYARNGGLSRKPPHFAQTTISTWWCGKNRLTVR